MNPGQKEKSVVVVVMVRQEGVQEAQRGVKGKEKQKRLQKKT